MDRALENELFNDSDSNSLFGDDDVTLTPEKPALVLALPPKRPALPLALPPKKATLALPPKPTMPTEPSASTPVDRPVPLVPRSRGNLTLPQGEVSKCSLDAPSPKSRAVTKGTTASPARPRGPRFQEKPSPKASSPATPSPLLSVPTEASATAPGPSRAPRKRERKRKAPKEVTITANKKARPAPAQEEPQMEISNGHESDGSSTPSPYEAGTNCDNSDAFLAAQMAEAGRTGWSFAQLDVERTAKRNDKMKRWRQGEAARKQVARQWTHK